MSNSSSSELGLLQIGQIAVPVSDLKGAIAFYPNTLGTRFLSQAPPGPGFFDCAGVRLTLGSTAREKAARRPKTSIWHSRATQLSQELDSVAVLSKGKRRSVGYVITSRETIRNLDRLGDLQTHLEERSLH